MFENCKVTSWILKKKLQTENVKSRQIQHIQIIVAILRFDDEIHGDVKNSTMKTSNNRTLCTDDTLLSEDSILRREEFNPDSYPFARVKADFGQSNFGQSIFGQRVWPANFGQSIFGQNQRLVVSGLANFGQSNFGQSIFGQSVFVCVVVVGFGVG